MTYAQYGTAQALDFNTLAGGDPTTGTGKLNSVWAVGGTNSGYGQAALANVSVGNTIAASNWASLIANTAAAATHQGTSITSVTAPVAGNTISFLSAVPTNLNTIYTSRLNAATQGSTTANTVVDGGTWSTVKTFTHTITFASGDHARYFFNAGGQLKITCTHANSTAGINQLMNNLASNVGTIVLSAPTTGSITIASTGYNGVTKIGGGGNSPTISADSGYFALGTSNTTLFTQTASTGPAGYLATFIRVIGKTNGPQLGNGDVGNVITLYTIWDEVPDGLTVGTGTTTTCTIVPPESTNLTTVSWGTPTVTGTVA